MIAPQNGSRWRNRRTGEVYEVLYHPCGPIAGFVLRGHSSRRIFPYSVGDAETTLTSRFELIAEASNA